MHRLRSRWTAVALYAALSTAPACISKAPDELAPGAYAGDPGHDVTDTPEDVSGEELFRALEADFVATCGKCHVEDNGVGPEFLALPDRYVSVVGWPGIVVAQADKSLLLTHPMAGVGHMGNNLDEGQTKEVLLPKIAEWLATEADALAGKHGTVGPVDLQPGFNHVDLGQLGPELEGMALSFDAEELGGSALELSQLTVHTTPSMGVHIRHPLFAVVGESGRPDPDPVDSYSNFEATFPASHGGPLTPSTLILVNWQPGAKLTIAFEAIDPVLPD